MASLRKETSRGRSGWRLQFRQHGKRRSLWLGAITRRHAEGVKRHVEELLRCDATNLSAAPETELWVQGLKDERLIKWLSEWHLIETTSPKPEPKATELSPFISGYITSRTDAKQTTRRNFRQTLKKLESFFGPEKDLREITKGDCTRFRRWLLDQPVRTDEDGNTLKKMAEATVAKHIKRCRTFFIAAVDDEIITSSPFDGVKVGKDSGGDFVPVSEEVSRRVSHAMPTTEWKLLWALARWCGLRVPSELRRLRWDQILWDQDRIHFYSPKTNSVRQCPIFPELVKPLLDAQEAAADGAVYLFPSKFRDSRGKDYDADGFDRYLDFDEQAYKPDTQFRRLLVLGGIEPWPKLFKAVRQTRRNELERKYPHHVVNHWLGHDSRTANEHYLRVSDDDFRTAANCDELRGVTGGDIPDVQPSSKGTRRLAGNEKTPEIQQREPLGIPGNFRDGKSMTPTGSEHAGNHAGLSVSDAGAVSQAVTPTRGRNLEHSDLAKSIIERHRLRELMASSRELTDADLDRVIGFANSLRSLAPPHP